MRNSALWFAAGGGLVHAALFVMGCLLGDRWVDDAPIETAATAVVLVLLPSLALWGAASAVHWWSPRAALRPHAGVTAPLAAGVCAGLVGTAILVAEIYAFLQGSVSDAVMTTGAAIASGLLTALCMRRAAASACEQCGYELTGLTADRCPECGAAPVQRKNARAGRSERVRAAKNASAHARPT